LNELVLNINFKKLKNNFLVFWSWWSAKESDEHV